MPETIKISDLSYTEPDVFARQTEVEHRNKPDPSKAILLTAAPRGSAAQKRVNI